ncbi:FAD-dependent oxidoreductase [Rhizobium ruizarguesonis]
MTLTLGINLALTGVAPVGGGGGASFPAFAYQTETNTLASAFSVAPTTARKRTMDRAMRRLKTSGLLAKARWISFAGADLDASLTNWKTPSEKATAVGTPLFTADQGYSGNTGLNYVNSGIQANVLSQNDHSIFAWYQTGHMKPTATQAGSTVGAINAGSQGLSIVPNATSNGITIRCGGASVVLTNVTDGFGLIGGSRNNSANFDVYYNGALRSTSTNTSAALPALNVYFGGLNNNGSISNGNATPMAFQWLGQALTQTEVKTLTAIVGEYLESIRYGEYYNEEPGIGTGSISKQCIAYGLTGQSVTFAVQAARQGKTVAIIGGWRDRFSFGMAGGGLGYTDFDSPTALGGLPRWIITDCNSQEGTSDTASGTNPTAYKFNPKRFNRTCKKLLTQYNIPVYLANGVASVTKTGAAITSITTTDGRTVTASQWHDGSYELDLIRLTSGIGWTKGREAAGTGAEANNGVRDISTAAQPLDSLSNVVTVDPWTTPGVTASGLLPGFQAIRSTFTPALDNYPTVGTADTRLPAYNFRLTFTNVAYLRIALPSTPPAGFDAANFETYLRWFAAATTAGNPIGTGDVFKMDNLQGTDRFDLNKQGILSTNLVGVNHNYPAMTYAEREVYWKLQWNHIMGLWYLLQYHADARVPAALRTAALGWGMCPDHYYSNHENDEPFFQPQMYVREAVRLVGSVVMNGINMSQTDGQVPTLGDHTVSVASYNMDSHSTQVVAHETSAGVWQTRHEGGMFVTSGGANGVSPLPFEIFVPKVAECTNVSCSFGGSLTHVAYGASRMEFTAMQTAQSMGLAASLAIDGDNVIQNVSYSTLRTALLASPVLSGEVAPVIPQTT